MERKYSTERPEKPEKIEMLLQYRNRALQKIDATSDMEYNTFLAIVAELCEIDNEQSCVKYEQLMLLKITCTTKIFQGQNFFYISDETLWKKFWEKYGSLYASEFEKTCFVSYVIIS
ncbi:hypothetical protein RFI_09025 [Reticulomyxa filosa]|uniref:Uncharacterized protein n=1 Tax=Reticulomyxa filosa TaxID=46433 RepID=X6NP96_RETFI|nr:hypothetical protein RFI_09025 [Reticulomyxa filosa]|eukprot:ETO28105.1 hypothetical protein RFI_09025 [Reticulomyxa filosa]